MTEQDNSLTLNEDQVDTLQEILAAVRALPHVWERVEAYLIARQIDNPEAAFKSLYDKVYGT